MTSLFTIRVKLFLAALLLPLLTIVISGFNGLYGQDAYAYLNMARTLDLLNPGVTSREFFWPILYPLFGSVLLQLVHSAAFAMQLISILSFALAAVVLYDLLCNVYDTSGKLIASYTFLFFVLSPYAFRFSTLVMSDMLCLLLVLIALKHALRKETGILNLSCAAVATVLAVSTRYVSILILIIPLIYSVFNTFRRRQYKALLAALFFSITACIPHLYFKGLTPHGMFDHSLLHGWSVLNSFRNNFPDSGMMVHQYRYYNIIATPFYLLHPAYCIFGSALLLTAAYMKIKRINLQINHAVLFALLIYLMFLTGIPFQNTRFLLMSFPLFLILMFPSYQFAVNLITKWKFPGFVTSIIIQLPLVWYAVNTPYQLSTSEQEITDEILTFNDKGLPIYTSGLEGPISYYLPEFEIKGLFRETVKGLESNFVLVIDSAEAMNQKQGSNLVVNLNNFYGNNRIIRRRELEKNWIIYEFER